MARVGGAVWCLGMSLTAGVAPAMDFANIPDGPGQVIIGASGEIQPGDALKLTGFLEAVQGERVAGYSLDSGGGSVLEGEKLALMINGQNVGVAVLSGRMCASACFLMFAAAARRVAAPDALIGVHSVSDGAGNEDLSTMGLTTALARDASAYNVPSQIIGELVTTKPGQITWLTVDELASMGTSFIRPQPAGYNSRDPDATPAAPVPTAPLAQPPGAAVAATVPATPFQTAPATATASLPPTLSPSFTSGLSDRKAWESWFASLTGPARDGAAFWASQRSLPHPQPCTGDGSATAPAWVTGCQLASQMLAPFDVRRRREPDYKRGWNSV